MVLLRMSTNELSRVEVLARVGSGHLSVTAAARVMGVSRRQAHRLLTRYLDDGPAGLISRKRGRASSRRLDERFREHVIGLVRSHYHDFGPTLAREYLIERHGITVACETLRQLIIQGGLWKDRDARRPRHHWPAFTPPRWPGIRPPLTHSLSGEGLLGEDEAQLLYARELLSKRFECEDREARSGKPKALTLREILLQLIPEKEADIVDDLQGPVAPM